MPTLKMSIKMTSRVVQFCRKGRKNLSYLIFIESETPGT